MSYYARHARGVHHARRRAATDARRRSRWRPRSSSAARRPRRRPGSGCMTNAAGDERPRAGRSRRRRRRSTSCGSCCGSSRPGSSARCSTSRRSSAPRDFAVFKATGVSSRAPCWSASRSRRWCLAGLAAIAALVLAWLLTPTMAMNIEISAFVVRRAADRRGRRRAGLRACSACAARSRSIPRSRSVARDERLSGRRPRRPRPRDRVLERRLHGAARSTASTSTRRRASSCCCSARAVAARRRCSRCSPRSSRPTSGSVRIADTEVDRAARRGADRVPAPHGRHRVPGVQPRAVAERARERHGPAAGAARHRPAGLEGTRGRAAGARRPRSPAHAPAGRDVGRPAATRRDRTGARARPGR